jgi:hypothetical protein
VIRNRYYPIRWPAATARLGASSYGRVYGFVCSGLDAGMALTLLPPARGLTREASDLLQTTAVSVREARFTIRNVPVAQQQCAFQSR